MLSYSLGGLSIQIFADFYCNLKKEGKDYDSFLDRSHIKKHFQAKIQINFKLSRQHGAAKDDRNKIHSQYQINLYAADNGGFELQCLNDGKSDILWNLVVDPEFFIFEYFLSPHDEKKNNCYRLAFNRFLLQHTFINHHGLIIHAAGGSIHGKGMVFPAISGTGKSTLSHLLLPFSENQLYSEERIIMRKMNDGWQLWGTPWKGTGVIARNESAPLSALVFLSQAPQTKISELAPSAALRRLLETVSIPWYSQEWTDKGFAVCESLLRNIPAFELAFRPDQTAVQALADLAASLP